MEARESLRKYKVEHGVFLYNPEYEAKLKVFSEVTVELAKLDAQYGNEKLGSGTVEAITYGKKRDRLVKILDDNRADLTSLPTVERELLLRDADAEVANTTYATVAKELKDAELRGDAVPDARLISQALPAQLPSRPRRGIITLVSLLAGLIVGVALAFFLEYINRTARGISDIENFVGLKVIGTIPVLSTSIVVSKIPHVRLSTAGTSREADPWTNLSGVTHSAMVRTVENRFGLRRPRMRRQPRSPPTRPRKSPGKLALSRAVPSTRPNSEGGLAPTYRCNRSF